MTNKNIKNNTDNKSIRKDIKSQVFVSALAGKSLLDFLKNHGFEINLIGSHYVKSPLYEPPVYHEVATHADIYMCQLGLWENARIFPGNIHKLQKNYPGNVIYNAVCTGKYFIHNLKYTSPELLAAAGINLDAGSISADSTHACACLTTAKHQTNEYPIPISVPQGYTRCTCLPVDDRSFITSDRGIAGAMSHYDTDILLIKPGHVKLPGFDYGFIGGCAGNIIINGQRTIIFNGDISAHPDYKKIASFIEARDIQIIYFEDYHLEDIGSILTSYI